MVRMGLGSVEGVQSGSDAEVDVRDGIGELGSTLDVLVLVATALLAVIDLVLDQFVDLLQGFELVTVRSPDRLSFPIASGAADGVTFIGLVNEVEQANQLEPLAVFTTALLQELDLFLIVGGVQLRLQTLHRAQVLLLQFQRGSDLSESLELGDLFEQGAGGNLLHDLLRSRR